MTKFSDFPVVGSVGPADYMPLLQGGANVRAPISLLPTGAGSGPFVSLSQYGSAVSAGYVVGSGGNDSPAIVAALAALAPTGGWMVLPQKINIGSPITVTAGVGLLGQGTVITPLASMAAMLVIQAGGTTVRDVYFSNAGTAATTAVQINKPLNNFPVVLENVQASGFTKAFWVSNGDVIHLVRPWTSNCGTAVMIDNGFLNSSIVDPYFFNGNGIDVAVPTAQQPEGFRVIGGVILPYLSGAFGVRLRGGLENSLIGVVIDQLCTGDNGIIIDSSSYAVRATKIIGCWTGKNTGQTATGTQILLTGAATVQTLIDGHTFEGYDGLALDVDGGTGINIDLKVTNSRFSGSGTATGDMRLRACRAIVTGNDFNHASNPLAVTTTGFGVHSLVFGNTFVASANPVIGNITGSMVFGNKGNTNDSLDQSVGVNVRANNVSAINLDVFNALVRTVLNVTDTGTTSTAQQVISATSNPNGATLELIGNGGTTPSKRLRAISGVLQVLNDAGTSALLTVDDAGNVTAGTSLATPDLNINGTGMIAGAWTTTFTPTITPASGAITASSGSLRYRKIGRMVFLNASLTITTNGTGSGSVNFTLPFASAAGGILSGREGVVSGKGLSGVVTPGSASCAAFFFDNSYPGANGAVLTLSGVYEASS